MSYSGWSMPQNSADFMPSEMDSFSGGDPYYGGPQQPQVMPTTEYIPYSFVDVERGMYCPVVSQHFDNFEELLWTGNMNGHITAFLYQFQDNLQRYVSFHLDENPILCLTSVPSCMLAAAGNQLRSFVRTGRMISSYTEAACSRYRAVLSQIETNNVLAGGDDCQTISLFDIKEGDFRCLQKISVNVPGVSLLRQDSQTRTVYFGASTGQIGVLDARTFKQEQVFTPHTGGLYDFTVHVYRLTSCGFVYKNGRPFPEKFLKQYDVRMLPKSMPPIAVCYEPKFVRCAQIYSDRFIVVTQGGDYELIEANAGSSQNAVLPGTVDPKQALCESFDISPTRHLLAFGDSFGWVNIHVKPGQGINSKSAGQLPNPMRQPPPRGYHVSMDDDIDNHRYRPFSLVPLPLPPQNEGFASNDDIPVDMQQIIYREPLPIDPQILNNIIYRDNRPLANNPRTRRRNQCPYKLDTDDTSSETNQLTPREPGNENALLSLTNNHASILAFGRGGGSHHSANGNIFGPGRLNTVDDAQFKVPKPYRRVLHAFPKFGGDDLSFFHCNKTAFAGLEPVAPGSYCHNLIQMLYFITPLRTACVNHLCSVEFCLACELGFLFHMLSTKGVPDERNGQQNQQTDDRTCQATNFLRAFRLNPLATQEGLVISVGDEATGKHSAILAKLAQGWMATMLKQLSHELHNDTPIGIGQPATSTAAALLPPSATQPPAEEEKRDSTSPPQAPSSPALSLTSSDHGIVTDCTLNNSIAQIFGTQREFTATCEHQSHINNLSISPVLLSHDLVYPELQTGPTVSAMPTTVPAADKTGDEKAEGPKPAPTLPPPSTTLIGMPHTFANVLEKTLNEPPNIPCCPECSARPKVSYKRIGNVLVLNTQIDKSLPFWRYHQQAYKEGRLLKRCRYGKECRRENCRFTHPESFQGPGGHQRASQVATQPLLTAQHFLSDVMHITLLENGQARCSICTEHGTSACTHPPEQHYRLVAIGFQIVDLKSSGNLVASILADRNHHTKRGVTFDRESQWYLFNDFVVTEINKDEALTFDADWKRPVVIVLSRADLPSLFDSAERLPFSPEKFLYEPPTHPSAGLIPLGEDEHLNSGDPVAIDSEFVTVSSPSFPIIQSSALAASPTSGGNVDKMAGGLDQSGGGGLSHHSYQMRFRPLPPVSVVRVSVIRGQGALDGQPFLDDYIRVAEQPAVDSVSPNASLSSTMSLQQGQPQKHRPRTPSGGNSSDKESNSGSSAGLSAEVVSRRSSPPAHLVTLKTTYVKLRCLIDIGVIFIGHGLKKDFKAINIVVPPSQIIDTVELFHMPKLRYVSLRFLAWYLLSINLQGDTHDSVEDSRTALRLYNKYTEYVASNNERPDVLEGILKTLYEAGKSLNWKVPDSESRK